MDPIEVRNELLHGHVAQETIETSGTCVYNIHTCTCI